MAAGCVICIFSRQHVQQEKSNQNEHPSHKGSTKESYLQLRVKNVSVAPDWPEEKKKLMHLREASSRIHTITEEEEASKNQERLKRGNPSGY